MAITISGENNNDKILAQDGVIDQISGLNIVGVLTATSFTGDLTGDVTGNLTGNVTGNINNTTLLLQTGGYERIRIDSSGRVLIGTTTEGASSADTLTIAESGNSGITIRSGTSNGGHIYFSDGTSGADEYRGLIHYDHASNYMAFWTNGTAERLRIDSTGHTTIKSGAHDKGLDIFPIGNSQETRLRIQGKNSSGTEHTFYFHAKQSANRLDIGGTGPICFIGSQNVGIQNAIPTSPLHVGDDVNPHSTKALLFVGPASGDGTFHLRGGSPTVLFDSTSGGDAKILIDGRNLIIRDGTFDSAGSEVLRISDAGKLGINEVNPTEMLHIKAEDNTDSFGGIIVYANNNSVYTKHGWRGLDSNEAIRFAISGTEKMRLTNGGKLALGRTSADEMIHITHDDNSDHYGGIKINANNGSVYAKYGWRGIDGSETIRFAIGGTEKVRIDSNGNLNIGATGSGNASVYARHILVSGSSNQGMTIHTTDTSGVNRKCCLFFGTGTSVADMADGMIFYDHAGQYMHLSTAGAGTGITKSSIRLASDGTVRFDSTPADANSISLLIKSHKARAVGDNNGIVFRDANDHSQAAINVTKESTANAASSIVFRTSDGAVTTTLQGTPERLRIGRKGQIGVAGANYGEARQTIVSNGSNASVSWSSNPFLLDMDSLGDIDYDGVFLRYREVNVTGNGLVHLGLCKSTTNCGPGRIGIPVGFIPGVVYNSHFRVDKVGITPWPDGSGHRYEFYAIISDYVSAGKLGIFYLTNSTN